MSSRTASAIAHPNIACIKYWGNCDPAARIPANGSISMNLDGLYTRTRVTFDPALTADQLVLDGIALTGPATERVSAFLDQVRILASLDLFARVESTNNFPMGAGIASSASAFAALSLAASAAAGLHFDETALSRLSRLGSGSACRSVPGGFVEWKVGECDADSAAYSIAPADYWDVVDCITLVSQVHKPIGSTEGHALAYTSPLQAARVAGAPQRLEACRRAILERDFAALAEVVELDSNLMHAVMLTSTPRLLYWQPATVTVMQAVTRWRDAGQPVCYTIDAGPNVHVLCPADAAPAVSAQLGRLEGVQRVLIAHPGGAAHWIED